MNQEKLNPENIDQEPITTIPCDDEINQMLRNRLKNNPVDTEYILQSGINIDEYVFPQEAINLIRTMIFEMDTATDDQIHDVLKTWKAKVEELGRNNEAITALGNAVQQSYTAREILQAKNATKEEWLKEKKIVIENFLLTKEK